MATIAVIGGGIIGSAAAAWLLADTHKVTVFERAVNGRPASAGNAGLIALPEITPLARLGIIASVPRWLIQPTGPLALRWRDALRLAPWLLRFLAAARPRRVDRATKALATLMGTALDDHDELARRGGLSGHMRRTGALHVYGSTAGFTADAAEWEKRRRNGVTAHDITADDARRMVPALSGGIAAARYVPDYWTVSSPDAILQVLRRNIAAMGTLSPREVVAIHQDDRSVSVITADGGDLPFDRVVIAAGVWSRHLVRGLGLSVALEPERGYNTTFARAPFDLPLPVFFAEHAFVATKLADGLRVGGAVELAAPDAPPDFRRAAAMRAQARRFLPLLPESGGSEWMGCRPSTPDSLPVIGADPRDPRIIYAFGHGHLGLTLSAVTARHVAGLVAGQWEPVLKPFGIERFQWRGRSREAPR